MIPYPIQDFRFAARYPAHKGINAWRWEFLRRNADYQAFYAEHKDAKKPLYCGSYGIRALYDPALDQAHRGMLPPASIVSLPTFKTLDQWKKVPGYTPEIALALVLNTLTEMQNGGDTLARINRALPIQPQLDAIREAVELQNEMEGARPGLERARHEEWPTYLRILDGLAEGVSHEGIAAVLYPEAADEYPDYAARKRVKKAAERALHLTRTFAMKGLLAAYCIATTEHRRVTAAMATLDPILDTDQFCKVQRAADALAGRLGMLATKMRLTAQSQTDSRGAGRAAQANGRRGIEALGFDR